MSGRLILITASWLFCLAVSRSPLLYADSLASVSASPPVVVTLYSYHAHMPWNRSFNKGLTQGLAKRNKKILFYDEYLDAGRFSSPEYYQAFYQYLTSKYAGQAPDILLTDSEPAQEFLLRYPHLFPGAQRIVFQTDESLSDISSSADGSWNINIVNNYSKSVEHMMRLMQPDNVYVIGDTNEPAGAKRLYAFRQLVSLRKDDSSHTKAKMHYLINLPLEQLKIIVSQLPQNSVIYYLLMFSDMEGNSMTPYQVAEVLARYANCPIFTHWQSLMGSGVLGGYQISSERVGAMAAGSVLDFLQGGELKINTDQAFNDYYDWQQLKRWDIDESRLPAGSTISGRPVSIVDRYQVSFIIAALIGVFLLLFSFLIYRNLLIHNIRKHSMLLANTDSLTGLNNRRVILPLINKEIARCNRFHNSACLLMADVDHFKSVNDDYGHLTGDKVLSDIAQVLQESLRAADTIARWGGEEFIILTPNTDAESGREVAEKLRVGIEQIQHPHGKRVTISFGVAAYAEGESFNSWVNRADSALYQAKKNGRNRVVVASDEQLTLMKGIPDPAINSENR